jgi:hypothetical protein
MLSFIVSPEFNSLIRNVSDVNSLYLTLLNRSGDTSGVSNWTAQLNAGVPLASIVADFLASDEFRAKIN